MPAVILHGQYIHKQTDEFMESYMSKGDIFDPRFDELNETYWERAQTLETGTLVIKTDGGRESILPLDAVLRTRLCRRTALPITAVETTLSTLSDLLDKQTAQSASNFIDRACARMENAQQLQNLLSTLNLPLHNPSKDMQSAAKIFEQHGIATVVASAASVVAFIQYGDHNATNERDKVETLLNNNPVVADFIVTYLSCLLRLKMMENGETLDDYALPLATRALMTLSAAPEQVEGNLLEWSSSILPPMLHHPAFFTVFDPNRVDIGYTLGCALALQLKEGIHIARGAMGLGTSFMVWFLDDSHAFDLRRAFQREHHERNNADAMAWAQNVLQCGKKHFSNCGLETDGQTALKAKQRDIKRFLVIPWHQRFLHDLAGAWTMLRKSSAAYGSKISQDFKMSHLDTGFPGVETVKVTDDGSGDSST